jgi:hypothetical protein
MLAFDENFPRYIFLELTVNDFNAIHSLPLFSVFSSCLVFDKITE